MVWRIPATIRKTKVLVELGEMDKGSLGIVNPYPLNPLHNPLSTSTHLQKPIVDAHKDSDWAYIVHCVARLLGLQ